MIPKNGFSHITKRYFLYFCEMADKTAKKTRNRLSFEEKTKIHLYRTEHPEASYEKIAVYFSELWEKRSIEQWCIDIIN